MCRSSTCRRKIIEVVKKISQVWLRKSLMQMFKYHWAFDKLSEAPTDLALIEDELKVNAVCLNWMSREDQTQRRRASQRGQKEVQRSWQTCSDCFEWYNFSWTHCECDEQLGWCY